MVLTASVKGSKSAAIGGKLKQIAVIDEPDVIKKILERKQPILRDVWRGICRVRARFVANDARFTGRPTRCAAPGYIGGRSKMAFKNPILRDFVRRGALWRFFAKRPELTDWWRRDALRFMQKGRLNSLSLFVKCKELTANESTAAGRRLIRRN